MQSCWMLLKNMIECNKTYNKTHPLDVWDEQGKLYDKIKDETKKGRWDKSNHGKYEQEFQ